MLTSIYWPSCIPSPSGMFSVRQCFLATPPALFPNIPGHLSPFLLVVSAGQRGSGAEILANVEVLLFLHRFQQGKASVRGWRGCSVNRAAESVLFAIILSLGLFLQICVLKGVTPSSEAVVWASAEGDGALQEWACPHPHTRNSGNACARLSDYFSDIPCKWKLNFQ